MQPKKWLPLSLFFLLCDPIYAALGEVPERMLKIKQPETTISIPLTAVEFVAALLPENIKEEIRQRGVSVEKIVTLARNNNFRGVIAIIEERGVEGKTVVAIE